MSDKQNSSPQDSSSIDHLPCFNEWKLFPQENSPQASGSESVSSKFEPMIETPTCIGSHLRSKIEPRNLRNIRSEYLANERYADVNSVSEFSTYKRGDDVHSVGGFSANGRSADVHSVSEYSAIGGNGDLHFVNKDISETRLKDIAYQLCAIGSSNPQDYDSDSKDHFSLNDISLEYWQLYSKTSPENFDFAMNILAYIEFLNDNSWKLAASYFDENIKKMIKYIWNEKKEGVNNIIEMQNLQSGLILKLMVDFTEWSQNRNYEFGEFLNYCVIMCQVAVISRKRGFKKAPLYVISQLRDRINSLKFENIVQTLFNIVVKEYAQKLAEYSRV